MMTEHQYSYTSWDGEKLFFRSWQPKKYARAVILLHRGHEHSARWRDVVEQFDLPGFAFFAWDARGHGRSPGARGYAENYSDLVRDLDTFVRHVSEHFGISFGDIVVLAHSVGAVIAGSWAHDYAPPIRGLILGSPALRIRLYVPLAIAGLRLLNNIWGKAFIRSYVKGLLLTHDPAKQSSYDSDPLITQRIAVNLLLGLHDAGTKLITDANAINLPVLILSSGADFVVKQSAQRAFYDALPHPRKEMQTFPGFRHDTFNELESHKPIGKAQLFIQDLFEQKSGSVNLRDADFAGPSRTEFDRLGRSLPIWHPKAVAYALTRALLHSVGRLSRGIRLGLARGFDSGAVLDYVYGNAAHGTTPVGRLIDRIFLNSEGWRCIRARKANLQILLQETIGRLQNGDIPPHIVDIAAGRGRYVLDTLANDHCGNATATLMDLCDKNVVEGAFIVEKQGLINVKFLQADAFDGAALAGMETRPDIAIVSGLYELFPDNAPVRRSLAGLAEACDCGAYLIYTNQPWHPQLEFIARTLNSHRGGAPWVMRCRSQQEMDQLVSAAGFRKIRQLVDNSGIFTVSLAQRA